MDKYDFNAYDAVIALVLTRYLKNTGNPKKELKKVIGNGEIEGQELADLLDKAATWAKEGLKPSGEPMNDQLTAEIKNVLNGFSGRQYVQSMDTGFAEFLDDFYHDRIAQ